MSVSYPQFGNKGEIVLEYPETKRDDTIDNYYGIKVEDPYRWLEDVSSPEVQDWIDGQNQLTDRILRSYPGRETISRRTEHLLEAETISHLVIRDTKEASRFFYLYKHPDYAQPVLCYQDGEKGSRRELINPATLRPDGTVAVDWFFPSWDGRYVAYGLSEFGTEDSVLYVYDIRNNSELSDVIPKTRWAYLGWNKTNTGFYYTRYPLPGTVSKENENYYRHVYYHQLGTDYRDDPKVFGNGRNPTEMSLVFTHPAHDWVLIIAWRYASSDIYVTRESEKWRLIPLLESNSAPTLARFSPEHVYLVTRVDAGKGRILRFSLDEIEEEGNETPRGTVVVEEGEFAIQDWSISTEGYLAYPILNNASHEVRIHDLTSGDLIDTVEFNNLVSVESIAACPRTNKLYLSVHSFVQPDSIMSYEINGKLVPFISPSVNLDPNDFKVEQVWYESKDSTEVPMFLISAVSTEASNKTPILIRGYGSGGISYTPQFFPEYMIWLEKGGILAIPNIRGGGEFGEEWHENGCRENKQNGFDDFIAAAEWLQNNGYGSPETTAMMGRSAGGFLVGGVLVQRPDLFASVYCAVPLLDMLRYTEFSVARIWMSECGNPDVEEEFKWIYETSPYHNVKENVQYPAVLFYTAVGDVRADSAHALKMAARLQRASSPLSTHPILLSTDRQAGHGVGLSTEKLVEIRTNQVLFHAKHTGLDLG